MLNAIVSELIYCKIEIKPSRAICLTSSSESLIKFPYVGINSLTWFPKCSISFGNIEASS